MLPGSLLNNHYFSISAIDPLEALTLECDCRRAWVAETKSWLANHDLEWEDIGLGIMGVKFNDTATLLMFKLAFAGTLSQRCRH